jgi:chromatin remodeling complex protein RSC6
MYIPKNIISMAKTPSKTSKAAAPKATKAAAPKATKAAAPKATKAAAPKATKTASASSNVTTEVVNASAETSSNVTTEVVNAPAETALSKIESGFSSLQERLTAFRELHAQVMRDTKTLHKEVLRSLRDGAKRKRPKRVLTAEEKANRTPNGFQQPVQISAELCNFLGKPEGSLVARTDVTSYFAEYVKKNELQDNKDRKLICPDDTLCKLLNLKKSDKITFFSMQTHMKHHYPKKSA